MSVEERIRHLLKIASRLEREGDERTARILRRAAWEFRPAG